ncbi:hypothetical protein CgunFtcFv8_000448 [Champsocephalus gunnari]|uniref:5-aminolevulinate synthase presequence domain-containing protein n=1 Tax=Champsocephalus gunnari TaxID=52237 RepID=A0AAN8HPV2_CHAGU|nr:hypothetical protein CgunFtcFv8_000448 [Champsocephalus gunnari]
MAAFLHHCPFLKSANKPALRRTGAALLSLAQISLSGTDYLEAELSVSPSKPKPLPTVEQRRLFAQTATQVVVSVSKGCPFVTSQIGVVQASPEVQEDVQEVGSSYDYDHDHFFMEKISEKKKDHTYRVFTTVNRSAEVFPFAEDYSLSGRGGLPGVRLVQQRLSGNSVGCNALQK